MTAKAHYESPFGRVSIIWTRNVKAVKLDISMPIDTYGKAVLRDVYQFENGNASVYLNGGQYIFIVIKNF